jgi:hypothetical protein
MANVLPPWLLRRSPRPRGAGGAANKFGAIRARSADGKEFASKAERDRYHILLTWQASGLIRELKLQPRWHFTINGQELKVGTRVTRYTADFAYVDQAGRLVVEDVKGVLTPDAALRIGLMRCVHGIEVQIIGKQRKR